MDMIQVLTVIGVAIANIGTTITLFIWSTSNAAEQHKLISRLIEAIQAEMKDFHGRLERQDAEFKAHLMYAHEKKEK